MPAFPKYGYIKDPEDKHHLVIDPEAAETVKLIFTMAADGKTKGQITEISERNPCAYMPGVYVQKRYKNAQRKRKRKETLVSHNNFRYAQK